MPENCEKLIIGSRDSQLALIQSNWVKDRLEQEYPDLKVEILKIKTQGDKILDVALAKIGDKGLFVKELETKLLDNSIDLAVHSMKDLPTRLPEGLEIAVTTEREDTRDVLCLSAAAQKKGINDISKAKNIGTSSLRRIAQLKNKYPHINFKDIRGNLNTRFKKLDDENETYDGIILAAAGIKRMALEERISDFLEPQEILPAVGQGALALEVNSSRTDVKKIIRVLNSSKDELIVKGERAFLRSLEGGCQVPIGIYSQLNDLELTYDGVIASVDGSDIIRASVTGALDEAEKLGLELAQKLLDMGAKGILDSLISSRV